MVKAFDNARKAIESLYDGKCSVIERLDVKDEKTKITRKSEVTVFKDLPCKLSFERINTVIQNENAAKRSQSTKLFLSPEILIREGSKIIVEQNGVKTEYSASGVPAIYPTHQEIMLELFAGWV